MSQLTIQHTFDLAMQHHKAGRLQEAEQLYRQVLAQQPRHHDALHYLGVIATQSGRNDIAIDLIRQALAINSNSPDAHNNLANILADKGRFDEAIASYRQAIALSPNYVQAHYNLGGVLKDQGRLDEAIAAYRQAIAINANWPEAHNNLGNLLKSKGRIDEAITAYHQAIALRPAYADAYINLAHALKITGKLDEAIAACRQAIVLRPNNAGAYSNLGTALAEKGHVDEAMALYHQAIALNPTLPEAHNNLGNALKSKGQLDEAVAAYRQAIVSDPAWSEAYNNLGNVLKDKGQFDEAIAAFRQALALNPNLPHVHSNLIFTLHYHPAYDAQAIAAEECRWNHQHVDPLLKFIQPHCNDRAADRRLRIGYVSPDLRNHVVGRNLLPLFDHHDHNQFEITCYAQVPRPDAMTNRFQQNCDRWRSIVGLSDEQVAQQIRQDQIDILVDLTLHSAANRLLVFARKPAPVQATFAGYPGSTGLSTIDYRLSDPYLDPPGMDESVYSEQTIRLPHSFWCHDPMGGREIPVNPLPALETGIITFGCLNNFCKVNDGVLALWAQVLRRVENSRLLLLAAEGNHRQRVLGRLRQNGVEPERVEFLPRQSMLEYLQLHHRVDVGLDTFPYNGHSTSLDSFWMGVPVVTLVGSRAVSRAGWCQLSNLGLQELAGQTPVEFVHIAVELANDLPRLQALRSTLRQTMQQSSLMDAPNFARGIEAAYRQMWRNWSEKESTKKTV